jgi:dUTPase
MKIHLLKKDGLVIPVRANNSGGTADAAYDVVASTPPIIVGEFIEHPVDGTRLYKRVAYIEYGTGLFIAPEENYHFLLHPRSSISRYNLALANSVGIIDNGYRNEIKVRFNYLFQPEDLITIQEAGGTRIYGVVQQEHIYQQGEKIVQLKADPNISIEFELVNNLNETQRGLGGFGSSGV